MSPGMSSPYNEYIVSMVVVSDELLSSWSIERSGVVPRLEYGLGWMGVGGVRTREGPDM